MKNKLFKMLYDCMNIVRAIESDDENIKAVQAELKEMKESEFVQTCRDEHVNLVSEDLDEALELYAKKRREEEVEQSFEDIKLSFQEGVKDLITLGFSGFDTFVKKPFAKELFDEFTDCKESDDSLIVSMKNTNSNINTYKYIKQWWKPKYLENKQIEEFSICLESEDSDIFFEEDIFDDEFKEGACFFKSNKSVYEKMMEGVEFVPVGEDERNKTEMPSWIKKLNEGKVSIKEISPLEKSLEFSDAQKYKIIRESESSDFWKVIKINNK